MPVALVIGASRGIGREFVRQLLRDGWRVWATARDDASLAELQGAGANALKLDIAKTESIAALGWQLDGEKLDLALFVADVSSPAQGSTEAPTRSVFDQVMHANVLGPMQLIPIVAPQMNTGGKCVFMSSIMGSIASTTDSFSWVYRASKAALNMAVKTASCDWRDTIFAAMHPGWVQTDMGGPNATVPVEQSVTGMLKVVGGLQPADSGSFHAYDGARLPW